MKFKVIEFENREVSFVQFPLFLPPMDITGLIYQANGKAWKILRVEYSAAIIAESEEPRGFTVQQQNNFLPVLYVTEIPKL